MEREDAVELAVAIGGVALFVAALAAVGATYGTGDTIRPDGRLPMLGVMILFVLSMGAAGFWLAERGD